MFNEKLEMHKNYCAMNAQIRFARAIVLPSQHTPFHSRYNAVPACNENSINVGWCSILKYFRKTVRLALFTQYFDLELYKWTSLHPGETLLFPISWDLRNGEKTPLPSSKRNLWKVDDMRLNMYLYSLLTFKSVGVKKMIWKTYPKILEKYLWWWDHERFY